MLRCKCVQPPSEEVHFKDEEHNADYDHEAFLGKDDVKQFDHMSPEDSKKQLGYDWHAVYMSPSD